MKLLGNVEYDVTIATAPGHYFTTTLNYGGGGCVDEDGHWVGGGVWYREVPKGTAVRHLSTRGGGRSATHYGVRVERPLPIACIKVSARNSAETLALVERYRRER